MRTLAEGSIDRARAKRTQRGQGLRPSAVTRRARSETKCASCPIPLSYWGNENALSRERSRWRRNRMWLSRPIPLSPWERGNGIETKWTSCPIPLSPWERGRSNCESVKGLAKWNELSKPLKKRQNTHKLVIFGTFMVKKWIFVIKMYSFLKNMLYLFTWTYQRGALICLRNSKRPS